MRIALGAGVLGLLACAPTMDTERQAVARGTLGEEVYRIACQRIAREAYPSDVSGYLSRELCRGLAGPETAAPGRLQALAEQRGATVEALDRVLPASAEDDLQAMLVNILSLYDLPAEVLPSNTRELGALLQRMEADTEATNALGRMAARRGLRSTELQLGVMAPALLYPDLPGVTRTALGALGDGGVAEGAFVELTSALALELATLQADDPSEAGTLDVSRALLASTHPTLSGGLEGWYAVRDERGLPVPRALGVNGFVDGDGDGLADVNADARFVDADGEELFLPTPYATALEAIGDTALRDARGLAAGEGGLPMYTARNADGTLLAALLRETRPWLAGETPVVEDAAVALTAQLGPEVATTRDFGELAHPYTSFDTSAGPAFDLVHATGALLDQPETRDALTLAQQLFADHESELTALIDAGLFGDAVAEDFPDVALRTDNELWDDVLSVAERMARRPGMMEALLRALSDPRSDRLGQILADMARHRDRPTLAAANGGRDTPLLRGQEWTTAVNRSSPDNGANQSLLQQTLSAMHELNGAEFCNKQDAHMIIRVAGLRIDLMDNAILRVFGLELDPFDRCELLRLENTTEAYVLSIQGRLDLEPQISAALPGYLTLLTDIADALNIGALTLDGILEDNSGIPGLTTTPTPEAMNRLVYSQWNEFLTEMLERPTTRDGVDVATRHSGNVLLAWERNFRFCGDQLLEGGQTCAGAVQNITFYEAFTPLLSVFTDFDPAATRTGDYLFGALSGALHQHYPTAANSMYQETNPAGVGYAHADGAVAYEPILTQLLGACAWVTAGGPRVCQPSAAAQLITRLGRLLRTADGLTIRAGVDGIDALTAVTEMAVDSSQHPTLRNRGGSRTTQTNSGSRTVNYSPVYLLLDALSAVDDAWEAAPEQHERWLRARGTVVDQLLTVTHSGTDFSLTNRRALGILSVVVDFLTERIDEHVADRDLGPWARGLTARLETTLSGPLPTALLHLFDAMSADPAARSSLFGLLSHLIAEDGGYLTTLVATHDLLQVLDDDDNMRPLGSVLATALASEVRDAIASGAPVQVDGSVADQTVELLRQFAALDANDTLPELLARAVTPRSDTDVSTPMDTLLDVIAEVNRTAPHTQTPFRAADHTVLFHEVSDFLLDPERGLERLYAVVQSREGE
ncbi:MAG: hypothetical protein IPG81_06850 [Sandaracinaceae bacterium]|nr:hypothetical protein [Sandaracinaceae bacterium]